MHTKEYTNFDCLTNDLLFKEAYSNPHNRRALEHLLEAYFNFPNGYLKDKLAVSYESILDKNRLKDKSIRSDLVIIINNTLFVNLEMYSVFTKNSLKKSKYYIMRIYSSQLNRGDNYNKIKKKVTQINFVDNVKIKIDEEVITEHYLINKELSDDFELDIARLDLIDKKGYNLSEKFKRQLKFLSAKSFKEREDIAKGDEILMDLNAWLEEYKSDEGLREFFDAKRWAKIEGHAEGFDEGREEGLEQGIEQGLEQGIEQGIEKGIEQSKLEIAKKMLLETSDLDFISRTTDLSLEEIKKLQKENVTEM